MGNKDTKAKEFLADNRRFADLFNYYLFQGKQVIQPKDLQERDTTQVLSLYGFDKREIQKQKWRDLLKGAIIKTSDYGIFVLLGVENQSDVHYAMPVRTMIYDAMNYGTQVNEAARKHKDCKDFTSSLEFLSGFKKDDVLTPIITLTVYWGADKWDAPRCLHDMFDPKYKKILPYVDNYHLHLIVPSEIDDFDRFQTSLGEVLEFIKASKDEAQMDKVVRENPEFRKLENDAVSAINVFTGIQMPVDKKGGVTDMCKAWEDHKKSGILEGRAEEIIETGYEFGLSENDILERLQKKLNVSAQKAQEYMKTFRQNA